MSFSFYGRLAIDLLNCEKLLLPKIKVRFERNQVGPNFYMLSDNSNVSMKIVDYSLFTRSFLEAEPNHQYLKYNLEREPDHYSYMETIARTSIIPFLQNIFMQENVFNNALISRCDVAVNTNLAVEGPFHGNPFNYRQFQQFHLRELKNFRGGRAKILFLTTSSCRPFVTTTKAMQFLEGFSALYMEIF